MNNKGFAVSSIMYAILVVFLIILLGILGTLGSRKVILDKLKKDLKEELENASEGNVWDYIYTGNYQEFVIPSNGKYKFELWGASGGSNNNSLGGAGAYTSGTIDLKQNDTLYLYVGESGKMQASKGASALSATFNGGGSSSTANDAIFGSGGGATDVRLVSGNWNDFNSLKSRIMVASSGGAGVDYSGTTYGNNAYTAGSAAGGIEGYNGNVYCINGQCNPSFSVPLKGTQTTGTFGFSGNSASSGGGSGYFGGEVGKINGRSIAGGASGSSFISGHAGCVAIEETSTARNISFKSDSIHYSLYKFTATVIKDGKELQIQPDGTNNIGHIGNGYIRITKIN